MSRFSSQNYEIEGESRSRVGSCFKRDADFVKAFKQAFYGIIAFLTLKWVSKVHLNLSAVACCSCLCKSNDNSSKSFFMLRFNENTEVDLWKFKVFEVNSMTQQFLHRSPLEWDSLHPLWMFLCLTLAIKSKCILFQYLFACKISLAMHNIRTASFVSCRNFSFPLKPSSRTKWEIFYTFDRGRSGAKRGVVVSSHESTW